jgi:hypothetical protein
MTKTKKMSSGMLCLVAGIMYANSAYTQLTVVANGSVGIGNIAPQGKLDVTVNPADAPLFSGRFLNNSTSNSTKYGLYSQVNSSGTGTRFGLYNITQSTSTSTGATYGQVNSTSGSAGGTFGLYNSTAGSTGFTYGLYNFTGSGRLASDGFKYGIYNQTSQQSAVNGGYGLYNSFTSTITNTVQNYGLYNLLDTRSSGISYGIYNQVSPFSVSCPPGGVRYGIYNTVSTTGPGTRYGIYSSTPGTANYAGFFVGNVYIQGNLTVTSDDKLKTGVASMKNAMDIIQQLDAKTYTFRKDIKGMKLADGPQVGLLASDVEKALPELVSEVSAPIEIEPIEICFDEVVLKPALDGEGNPMPQQPKVVKTAEGSFYSLKSVNYTALIPVLIQAMKEQQKTIQELKEMVEKQQVLISKMQPAAGK